MPFFDGARGKVHYRRWPAEEARARIVLLPGTGQHGGHYHRFARLLAPSAIELWAIDHVGHGLSEGDIAQPPPIAALGANAAQLAELAAGLPLVLMGHSLGAVTAVTMAPEPFVGTVLCGTPKSVTHSDIRPPERPTLVIHGVDDRRAPLDAVRSWIDGAASVRLIAYPDAGHDLLHEPVHARVTADVAGFVLDLV